jgi:hypothetical protein
MVAAGGAGGNAEGSLADAENGVFPELADSKVNPHGASGL